MVAEDAKVTVSQVELELGVSLGSVRTILHEKCKISAAQKLWVPRVLTQE